MPAYSDVEICNLALIRCGAPTIGSLSEKTEPARVLNKIFPIIRDAVLQKADWNFARKEQALVQVEESFQSWAYCYAYPTDCLEFRYICQEMPSIYPESFVASPTVMKNVPYEVRVSSDGNSRLILTDKYQAVGVYTRQITNSGLFSPLFIDALASRLAAELASTLLINTAVHNREMQKFVAFIAEAAMSSASEDSEEAITNNPIAESRS